MTARFRIKFILEDGRKVYMSKRGLIHLQDEKQAAECCSKVWSRGSGYTSDLGAYGDRRLYEPSGVRLVSIILAVSEPGETPVDPEAFVLGGVPAASVGVTD